MKKITKSILCMGVFFLNAMAVAQPMHTLTIVNQANLPMTVQYDMCNADNTLCSFIKEKQLSAVQSGNNTASVVGELSGKLETLTITSATIYDNNGTKVASLDHRCTLPANAASVILNDDGNSHISCQMN